MSAPADAVAALHAGTEPSRWVQRWSHLVPPGATLLDVACGSGRHLRWFAARGARVTGVDRDAEALRPLAGLGELLVADIEAGPWPWHARRFDAVVVTNYLWRERLADVVASVAPGGVLIYETFSEGHAAIGKPSNPKFLLRHGELLQAAAALRVVAFEEGFDAAAPRFVQRIVAWRALPGAAEARRCLLSPAETTQRGMPARVNSRDSEDPA